VQHLNLTSLNETLNLSEQDWLAMLRLAKVYGWQGYPMDTCAIGPTVASTLARALRDAMPDIPRHDALREKFDDLGAPYPTTCEINLFEWFSGQQGRDILGRVIRMCDTGTIFISGT
jgi:hypothetical protein